jgi:hypothetical protein
VCVCENATSRDLGKFKKSMMPSSHDINPSIIVNSTQEFGGSAQSKYETGRRRQNVRFRTRNYGVHLRDCLAWAWAAEALDNQGNSPASPRSVAISARRSLVLHPGPVPGSSSSFVLRGWMVPGSDTADDLFRGWPQPKIQFQLATVGSSPTS